MYWNNAKADYLFAAKSGDQAAVGVNTDIVWGTASPTTISRGIAFDGTLFTLRAGGIYLLEAAVLCQVFSVANGLWFYEFVGTDNVAVGNSRSGLAADISTAANVISAQPIARSAFQPTVETQVKLRCTSVVPAGLTATAKNICTWLTVLEIT